MRSSYAAHLCWLGNLGRTHGRGCNGCVVGLPSASALRRVCTPHTDDGYCSRTCWIRHRGLGSGWTLAARDSHQRRLLLRFSPLRWGWLSRGYGCWFLCLEAVASFCLTPRLAIRPIYRSLSTVRLEHT